MPGEPPLTHLRVVDLTDLRGALVGRMLAELGAEVWKVEPPAGDPERTRPPFAEDSETSLAFLVRHAGKRGVVCDLATPAGRERLTSLCDSADVLVENFDPATRTWAGLRPADVRARHPRLVHVAVADCGLDGPRAAWRLEPLPALAASGALFASGPPDRPPCGVPGYLAHDCAAAVAVVGALAAIHERARTGAGQTVEVSVEEAALATLAPWGIPLPDYAKRWPVLPDVLPRDGDGPAMVVPTGDGFVRMLAITPHQLRGLIALLRGTDGGATPAVRTEPRQAATPPAPSLLRMLLARGEDLGWATLGVLAQLPLGGHGLTGVEALLDGIRRVAGVAFRRRRTDELVAAARRLRMPMAPVQTPAEFVDAAQSVARESFVRHGFPGLGDAPLPRFPCRLSATPAALRGPAPARGADEVPDAAPSPASAAPAGAAAACGLATLRVVDLGVGAVVPEMCRQLAELGADVIKIEPARSLDFLRRISVAPRTPNASWMFNDTDRGRRSVRIDVDDPDGRALALRLCAAADVVAENRTAGVVERWGLGYADVRAQRPDVIWVSSQGFGRSGPFGEAPAYGPLAAAFSGVSWLWSHADDPRPSGTSLEHPDHYAGRLLAGAVLAALEHRARTGQGQQIDCAQSEAAAYPFGECYAAPPTARGNAAAHACPHGVYPARGRERWIAIAILDDAAWRRFRTHAGWPDDETLRTASARLARREFVDARVAAWTRGRDAMTTAAALQAIGISAMPVQDPLALRADAHLVARGALVRTDDPEVGTVRHVGSALRMSATPAGASGPAPALGAHTDMVLADWLGLAPAEIAALRARGVVG